MVVVIISVKGDGDVFCFGLFFFCTFIYLCFLLYQLSLLVFFVLSRCINLCWYFLYIRMPMTRVVIISLYVLLIQPFCSAPFPLYNREKGFDPEWVARGQGHSEVTKHLWDVVL